MKVLLHFYLLVFVHGFDSRWSKDITLEDEDEGKDDSYSMAESRGMRCENLPWPHGTDPPVNENDRASIVRG